ncbi:hypothetical protein B005_0801 [Nocardiopsis alba ATCC BAA-2165]|uniref:Uncharacterized protein n=1 Tax=Nocardiopsis alba (strain ATCC BAA-2165 / BE74) TaxID=1205910 RepID=J7L145_NOCAA|nr:hypothetical protein B005_0801 [Nocardiopsis alba ATCC BAA-2165]
MDGRGSVTSRPMAEGAANTLARNMAHGLPGEHDAPLKPLTPDH